MNLSIFSKLRAADSALQPLPLFLLRLWLAQEFIYAGWVKVSGGLSAPQWFAGPDFPFPVSLFPADLNWALAGMTELLLGITLLLGLASRVSATGLLFIVWVAVYSVHFDLGFAGWNQIEADEGLGFKLPLMMAIMLSAILINGAGRWSLDYCWQSRQQHAGLTEISGHQTAEQP